MLRKPDAAAGAATEPTARALFDLVSRSTTPIGRDAAAAALGIPRATAAFHLDKLVEAGLLTAEFRRLSGRTGPGAGRPAKLYQRAGLEVTVSLPERRYDLAGDLLSTAIEEAGSDPIADSIERVAARRGRGIGADAGTLDAALESIGYQPVEEQGTTRLYNCPFHRLATSHTETICRLNVALVQGMAEGCGDDPDRVRFAPGSARCCVRIDPADQAPAAT
ncbi:MAG TPA: helix-turn-helix domain-containing protein [Amnibacterium sp.]|nr:helix-turn-helix domain-containing protein [Amnibacterium sp.]